MNAYRQVGSPPHNPTVETQRPGYSVYDALAGLFVVAAGPPSRYQAFEMGPISRAKVYETEWLARADAKQVGSEAVVTRAPRFNGHVIEAEVLP